MRIEELKIELNTCQMQLASLFTSIQQVETRRQREEETTEEYNCHKALANLTQTRYLKQMEKMSKQFRANTPLTNYPMPKSKNSTVLTNNISHKNDQILIPNIENNITDQLNKLGISKSLTPTDNTNTNTEVEQLKVTQDNRLRKTLHETMSAHNGVKQKKIMMTTNQSTPDGTSQNVKAKQKKITEENKATETIKQNKLTEDGASRNVKVKEKKITETTNQSTPDVTSQNVKVKEKKIMEENKAMATTNQSTADVTSENVIVKEKKITEENKAMATTNQSTPDVTSQNVKVKEKKITEENKATATTNQQKITEEENQHPMKKTKQWTSKIHQ